MRFEPTSFEGLYIIHLDPFIDDRGFFGRNYCKEELKAIGHTKDIVQINHSITKQKGTFRGLHYQHQPHAEIKIIRCIRGEVFDVVVDLREASKTYLKHFIFKLKAEDYTMLYIPEGFAHGFQTLTNDCELLYLHTGYYAPNAEAALNIDDPKLNISLPLPISNISERDKGHAFINKNFKGE